MSSSTIAHGAVQFLQGNYVGVEGFDNRGKAPSVVIVDRAGVASSFAIMSVVGEQTNDIFFFGVCLSVQTDIQTDKKRE